jgi:hypothetical protein
VTATTRAVALFALLTLAEALNLAWAGDKMADAFARQLAAPFCNSTPKERP